MDFFSYQDDNINKGYSQKLLLKWMIQKMMKLKESHQIS